MSLNWCLYLIFAIAWALYGVLRNLSKGKVEFSVLLHSFVINFVFAPVIFLVAVFHRLFR